jgi:hypothetical protein
MIRSLALLVLLLAGCNHVTQDLGNAGKAPGEQFCYGKATITGIGQAVIYGANFSLSFDCGNGAYWGQGQPTGPLPSMPTSPQISDFLPLNRPIGAAP